MLLLLLLRPREPFNLLIGAQLDSRLVLTINLLLLFQEEISLKLWEPFAWLVTLLLLLKSLLD
jgi:hypothetical protein